MKRALLALAIAAAIPAHAMGVRVAGNQLILSGAIAGNELAQLRDALPANPQINTVVLKDSPGGDVWTAMRLGELFTERRFRTAVSGYCMSACVIAFLGGVERQFSDGKAGGYTFLAIHTPTYSSDGLRDMKGSPSQQARGSMLHWMGRRVKDVSLLELGLSNDNPRGYVYLYDPARAARAERITAFACNGTEKNKATECKTLDTDALKAGFITTTNVLEVAP